MRKLLYLFITLTITASTLILPVANAEDYTTLYAEDGRSASFKNSEVAAQLTVGWYTEPVQRLYAEGKSKLFKKSEVAAQLTVGWYTEPVQRLYAEGKSKLFKKSEVAAQLTVGWYTEPVQRLYAEGKSKLFKKSEVAAQLTVGWYTEPVQRLYAPGKSKLFKQSEVAAQLNVGWYTEPVKANTTKYVTYSNARFGFTVDIPSNFIWCTPPDNGDGRQFYSPNYDMEITASGIYSVLHNNIRDIYNDDMLYLSVTPSYKSIGNNWYVASWYKGSKIRYRKTYLYSGIEYTLDITYPSSKQKYYSDIVTHISNSFSP